MTTRPKQPPSLVASIRERALDLATDPAAPPRVATAAAKVHETTTKVGSIKAAYKALEADDDAADCLSVLHLRTTLGGAS